MFCLECYSENAENSLFCENCGCPFEAGNEQEEEILKNRYKIITSLSSEDTVFLSYDLNLNRPCVVKIMADLQDLSSEEKGNAEQSFRREASLLTNLRHPNLPCITDYFLEDDFFYIIMDYIRGKNLEVLLRDSINKALSERQVIQWLIQICRIMDYLYNSRTMLYGNLKLHKFIVRDIDKSIILVDFGTVSMRNLINGRLTEEQDIRNDIYLAGVIMYQLLTGEYPDEPLKFSSIREIRPELSRKTDFIVMKCLHGNVKDRFSDFNVLKQNLLELYTVTFGTGNKYKAGTFITKDKEIKPEDPGHKYINILIVDDDLDICQSFNSMVNFFEDIKVIGMVHNGLDAVKTVLELEEKPDVILMDLRMPDMDGLEATEKIMQILPCTKIIILTAYLREDEFLECFNAGATGYILKDATLWEELEKAIRKAFEGGTPISPEAGTFLIKALASQTHRKVIHEKEITGDEEKDPLKQICPFCRNLNKDKAKYCTECGINIIKFLTEGKLETAYDKDLREKNNISEDPPERSDHEHKYEDTSGFGIKTILDKAFQTLDHTSALKLPEFINKKINLSEAVGIEHKAEDGDR
ncbi:MAG: response regulator [Candidatus Eremiobacterota bacterium]